MAKMKVHELAKELDKQSKDILTFLQEKGIEGKVAQSALEEDAVNMVCKKFGKAEAPKVEAPKATPKVEEVITEESVQEETLDLEFNEEVEAQNQEVVMGGM